jgi:hypothetical protein
MIPGVIGGQVGIQVIDGSGGFNFCVTGAFCQGNPGPSGYVYGSVGPTELMNNVFLGPSFNTTIIVPNPVAPLGIGLSTTNSGTTTYTAPAFGIPGASGCAQFVCWPSRHGKPDRINP